MSGASHTKERMFAYCSGFSEKPEPQTWFLEDAEEGRGFLKFADQHFRVAEVRWLSCGVQVSHKGRISRLGHEQRMTTI